MFEALESQLRIESTPVPELRVPKKVQPRIFDREVPIVYGWELSQDGDEHIDTIAVLASKLYQLGRGVDLAWARSSIIDRPAFEDLLEAYPGPVLRPTPASSAGGRKLACLVKGSLESLEQRYAATLARFSWAEVGGKRVQIFSQPPKPKFEAITYEAPPARSVFDLRDAKDRFAAQPLTKATALVDEIRDAAAARLRKAVPNLPDSILRALTGRMPAGLPKLAPADRVRIIPLPSIGHEHTSPAIRRLIVEVPGTCPLERADVFRAFSGLRIAPQTAGLEPPPSTDDVEPRFELTPAHKAERMLDLYAVTADTRRWSCNWQTVTPVALPVRRRRLERNGKSHETKEADERLTEEAAAVRAVRTALRHAGITASPRHIDVRREPFARRGQHAQTFATATRFSKHRLWHVDISFDRPRPGPLIIGDGRFLGLGLMQPKPAYGSVPFAAEAKNYRTALSLWPSDDVLGFRVTGGWRPDTDPEAVVRTLRRATMALYQAQRSGSKLPALVSGHDDDGGPERNAMHLHFTWDAATNSLLVIPPHVAQRRAPRAEERFALHQVGEALAALRNLYARCFGRLTLQPTAVVFPSARQWISSTPYVVNRHRRSDSAQAAVRDDLLAACAQIGLPRPEVIVHDARGISSRGLEGQARLHFATTVRGPIALGRTRFMGGGWFVPFYSDV